MRLDKLRGLHVPPPGVTAHQRHVGEGLAEQDLVDHGHHVVLVVAPFQQELLPGVGSTVVTHRGSVWLEQD